MTACQDQALSRGEPAATSYRGSMATWLDVLRTDLVAQSLLAPALSFGAPLTWRKLRGWPAEVKSAEHGRGGQCFRRSEGLGCGRRPRFAANHEPTSRQQVGNGGPPDGIQDPGVVDVDARRCQPYGCPCCPPGQRGSAARRSSRPSGRRPADGVITASNTVWSSSPRPNSAWTGDCPLSGRLGRLVRFLAWQVAEDVQVPDHFSVAQGVQAPGSTTRRYAGPATGPTGLRRRAPAR